MLDVSDSGVVAAQPEAVWELLCDTTRYAEWVAGTAAVTRTDGPARQGSTYEEVNPILGPWKARTHWQVVEFEPPHRQVHVSTDVPLSKRFEVVMELEPDERGTRFTLTLHGAPALGPVGALADRLMRSTVERDNRRSLQALAELVERSQSSRS